MAAYRAGMTLLPINVRTLGMDRTDGSDDFVISEYDGKERLL